MDKKYLLIGGIALFAAWWFFFREKDEADTTTADNQPEGNEEAEEEENTTTGTTGTYGPRNRGTGITATPVTPVNRTGTGNRSNTGRGNGRITVEPIKYHFELKTITVPRNE